MTPSHCRQARGGNIYLATDNVRTQARIVEAFGQRMRAVPRMNASSGLRQSTLRDAVVDLFLCAAADGPFKGSWTSSFSDVIVKIRRSHGRAHPADEHVVASVTKLDGDRDLSDAKVTWARRRDEARTECE